jgi:hypothetical protein
MPYNKNVFVLGAGASEDAGAPLLSDFLRRARDLVDDTRSTLTAQERERFGHVFTYRFDLLRAHAAINVDLDNLEDLFSICDLEGLAGDAVAASVKPDFVFLIVKTLELLAKAPTNVSIGAPHSGTDPYLWFVQKLARLQLTPGSGFGPAVLGPSGLTDSIISFNYDTVIDDAFRRAGLSPVYNMKGVRAQVMPPIPAAIPLIKLHGSANWSYCPTCGDVQLHVPGGRPPVCGGTVNHPRQPLIVPPTWNKGTESALMAPLWQAATQELSKANRIFIIGYSAPPTDTYFTFLMASALAKNNNLKEVILVNPRMPPALVGLFSSPTMRKVIKRGERFFDFLSNHFEGDIGRPTV